jgi:transposase
MKENEQFSSISLHPQATCPIPEETQQIARAAFPRGNLYMQVPDRLGTTYHDAQFAALFPRRGQPKPTSYNG